MGLGPRCFVGCATLGLAPLLGGCGALLGESFDGYSADPSVTDGGDSGPTTTDSSPDALQPDAGVPVEAGLPVVSPAIDDCSPSFLVSNGVSYPANSQGPCEIPHACPMLSSNPDGFSIALDTDSDKVCYGGNDSRTPYCLILASSIRVKAPYGLFVSGSRPLVFVAVHDFIVEEGAMLNVAGAGEGGASQGLRRAGPGDHKAGSSPSRGGGGGNAETGGKTATCGQEPGAAVDVTAGLVGGGHGGGILSPTQLTGRCLSGGLGGGAVQIVSLCGTIRIDGVIDATGGAGSGGATLDTASPPADDCPNGAGGGAGGTVWLQAARAITFQRLTGPNVDLSGGGGGGGACRNAPGEMWREGGAGNNPDFSSSPTPGVGASCSGGSIGGSGGAGASFAAVAGIGASPPQIVIPGAAGCGGGGGGRGRLVLQVPQGRSCDDAFPFHNGRCTQVP
jgi:hypothetical protein